MTNFICRSGAIGDGLVMRSALLDFKAQNQLKDLGFFGEKLASIGCDEALDAVGVSFSKAFLYDRKKILKFWSFEGPARAFYIGSAKDSLKYIIFNVMLMLSMGILTVNLYRVLKVYFLNNKIKSIPDSFFYEADRVEYLLGNTCQLNVYSWKEVIAECWGDEIPKISRSKSSSVCIAPFSKQPSKILPVSTAAYWARNSRQTIIIADSENLIHQEWIRRFKLEIKNVRIEPITNLSETIKFLSGGGFKEIMTADSMVYHLAVIARLKGLCFVADRDRTVNWMYPESSIVWIRQFLSCGGCETIICSRNNECLKIELER